MLQMEEVYKQYADAVYRYLLSLSRDENLAEELTQETFYQAVRGADRFDGSCKVFTWLCAIAKNQLYAYNRKNHLNDPLDEACASTDSAEHDVLAGLGRVELLRLLHELGDPLREVMYLRLFGTLSFREIGDIVGQTENWARVMFYRGKEKLRKEMDENG